MVRVEQVCLIVLTIVVGGFGLYFAKSVLVPFVLSLLLAFILAPLVLRLEKWFKLPRALSLLTVSVLVIALVLAMGALVTMNVKGLASSGGLYQAKIQQFLDLARPILLNWGGGNIDASDLELRELAKPLFHVAQSASRALLDLVADSFLIMMLTLFLLSGENIQLPRTAFFDATKVKVRAYLVTKLVSSGTTGLLTTLVLSLFGADLAGLFGLLAFVLNFIPTLGSIVAVLLPVPVIFVTVINPVAAIAALLCLGAIQFIIGNVLEPKFMGDSLGLHPVTVLLALLLWGLIWGVPGMLIAAPLTVIIKIALSQSSWGQGFGQLLSGKLS